MLKKLCPFKRLAALGLAAAMLAGCSQSTTIENGYDPLIPVNRASHSFNKGLDQVALRPLAKGYGAVVPQTFRHVVGNELRFLALPGSLANSLLQGDLRRGGQTAARMVVNATLGGLGALDPASDMDIPEHDEDFGQTLAVWGLDAGPYIELPVLGPSSVRGVAGRAGDMLLDPLTFFTGDVITYLSMGKGAMRYIDTRYRYADAIDAALYESPDSYLTVRNLYLQRRKAAILNGNLTQEDLPDIYEAEPF